MVALLPRHGKSAPVTKASLVPSMEIGWIGWTGALRSHRLFLLVQRVEGFEENNHEANVDPPRACRASNAGHARSRALPCRDQPRCEAARSLEAARLADERLRVLHRHALERPAEARRERAAAVRARRVARVAVLH